MPERYGRPDWRDPARGRDEYYDDQRGERGWAARMEEHRRRPPVDRQDRVEDDFGQADYSRDWGYDPSNRTGYRLDPAEQRERDRAERRLGALDDEFRDERYSARPGHREERDYEERSRRAYATEAPAPEERELESRSWRERGGLGGLLGGERRSNDRVIWVVATDALRRARGVDASDVDIHVEDGVITLNGNVRSREEKRRIEDLVDQRGVRDVRNHLTIRERRFGF